MLVAALIAISWPAAAQATNVGEQVGSTAIGAIDVTVIDMAERLSDEDVANLQADTQALDFPPEVQAVRYLTFETRGPTAESIDALLRNLNDTVEIYLRENHPDWILENAFAQGELIVAVNMMPRRNGIYCGNDVCSALNIYDERRLDHILEQMVNPLRDGRIAIGLYEGAAAAADPSGPPMPLWQKLLLGAIAALGGLGALLVFRNRKKTGIEARENFLKVQEEYGGVAQRLDAINIRAHSLTSPIANEALRAQWHDVHRRFLSLNDALSTPPLSDLTQDSSVWTFLRSSQQLKQAELTVTQMETAEDNIDIIYDMEHGDTDMRRRQLRLLRKDITDARHKIRSWNKTLDESLQDLLERIDSRVAILDSGKADPDFMDFYADLIDDYSAALVGVERDLKSVRKTTERKTPCLYDSDWSPGTGYGSYIPFYMINSWHQSDLAKSSSGSGSSSWSGSSFTSANTSFSSGFSGGGGSRGW